MNYIIDDYYTQQFKGLKPEYQQWVKEQIMGEDYSSCMDLDEALKEAYEMQQADEFYNENTQYLGYIIL